MDFSWGSTPSGHNCGKQFRFDPNAWDLDPSPLRDVVLKHPVECEPRAMPGKPKWVPRRAAVANSKTFIPPKLRADWGAPQLVTAADAGAVRTGMTWRKSFVTSASFSLKVGRTMSFEGPHEAASFKLLEIDHETTDFQFQPAVVQWVRDGSVTHEYYFDSVEERSTGLLIFRENKASQAYFDNPEINAKLKAAEGFLRQFPDVGFHRELGSELMHPLRWRLAKDIFDDRRVVFTEKQREDVADLLARNNGMAPLAKVWEAIGGRLDDARRITNAMMVARLVGYPFDRKPVGDTKAVLPKPPTHPGRLRQFLASFARKGEP